jgi:large subunit ribosomal protein L10
MEERDMPRPEKVAAVAEVKERIERAHAVFLAEYAGLSVKAQQELRRGLRASDAEFKVLKMTLARRAMDELDLDALDELLVGPTGIAFADGDPVSAAKVLKDFASTHDVFTIKGGLLGRDVLTSDRVKELAEIAPREVLLAKLAGAIKAPLSAMASLLAALPRGTATAMQQLLEKKQAGEHLPAGAGAETPTATEPEAAVAEEAPVAEDAEVTDETAGTEPGGEAVPVVDDAVETETAAGGDTGEDETPRAAEAAVEDSGEADDPAATAEEE